MTGFFVVVDVVAEVVGWVIDNKSFDCVVVVADVAGEALLNGSKEFVGTGAGAGACEKSPNASNVGDATEVLD